MIIVQECDSILDIVGAIRDEYVSRQREALTQLELHASQGDAKEASHYSCEAERHGAAVLASRRILDLVSAKVAALESALRAEVAIRQVAELKLEALASHPKREGGEA